MRYIDELNSFHDWLMTNPSISTPARILWYALMHYCNKTGWKEEFNVAISALELDTGLARSAIIRARNVLQQSGRIMYRSRAGRQSATYTIIPFASFKRTQSDTQSGTQHVVFLKNTQSEPQGEQIVEHNPNTTCNTTRTKSVTIPRLRLDETRLNKKNRGNDGSDKAELDRQTVSDATTKRFVPPTVEEVQAYCDERQNAVDAVSFVDFYEAKGWYVGKNKMKNWRAAVRTWERRHAEQPGAGFWGSKDLPF